MEKEYGPAHTTQEERFGGFALAHFGLSGGMWLGIFCIDRGLFAFVVPSLLAYFPLGVFAAWLGGWTAPITFRERWQAVAYPTAVAWAWVGFVILAVDTADETLLLLAFALSITLAAPSSGFVLITMILWENEGTFGLALIGLVAGVIPPLLFAWGSFCQARWAEKRVLKNQPAALPGA